MLVTELRGPNGLVAVSDALALRPGSDLTEDTPGGRQELIRSAVVLEGSIRLVVELGPGGGATARAAAGGLSLDVPGRHDLDLHVRCSRPLEALRTVHELHAGDRLDVVLSWGSAHRHHRFTDEELLDATARSWRRWMQRCHYDGPEAPLVRRSALTLKLCDHWSNGALVAAPTSSLPAPIGGVRNWDYRYTWIRDAAFSLYALLRLGFTDEAAAFMSWLTDRTREWRVGPSGPLQIMYGIDGRAELPEIELDHWSGYRDSRPVRIGNA
ncbi:MAG TPA: glycoside hydrolase family 15 protein, partial [Solirubrobacteraceae bacterium]|nr:glycoside hydrolase family 15 protein [Solirubrobacteraceae bacterium]